MSDTPILEVKNVTKQFSVKKGFFTRSYLKAVDNVSFSINSGKTLGLVGESGCGKSTLGRVILRLHEATSGQVLFNGKNVLEFNDVEMKLARRDMQMIFQDPYASLNPRMTISELLHEPLTIHGVSDRTEREKTIFKLMDIVGLRKQILSRYPHEFSGGQRQRIGIARALTLNPKLIVADEPVSALDVSVQSQVLNLISDLKEEFGITFLFIAHDLAVVQHISDEVAVMYLGQIVERTDSVKLYENPLHPYTKALLSAIPIPDPRKKNKQILLEGEVPSPLNPPSGCHFHPRCPMAQEICKKQKPELKPTKADAQHFVNCLLIE